MLNGKYCGQDIGSGTDVWKFSEDVKAGIMSLEQFMDAEACMSRSAGHCMVMGTASTMASMVEALGLGLPYNAALPAVDSRRYALAHLAGRRIVDADPGGRPHLEDPDARRLRERDSRQRRDRRLDQRRDPPARHRRPRRRAADAGRLGRRRPRRADARRSQAVGPVPDGGLPLRGRPAGGDSHARRGRPAQPRRDDGQRQDDLGELQRRAALEHRGHPADRQAAGGERRHRRAARQPRARRRGAQAVGRVAAADEASRPRHRLRHHRALQGAHQRSGAERRRRRACWCCGTAGRSDIRAWRKSATWACRRRC